VGKVMSIEWPQEKENNTKGYGGKTAMLGHFQHSLRVIQ
jgi:hypothetical protein